jgi:hypothetical protein
MEQRSAGPKPASTVPERFDYEAPFTVRDPEGNEVELQIWADRSKRDAVLRTSIGVDADGDEAGESDTAALRAPIGVILGYIPAGRNPVQQDEAAVARYGAEWVGTQLNYAQELIAFRAAQW